MAMLITFPVFEDRLRAIDILADAGEGYEGVPPKCYFVSYAAVKLLRAEGVGFRVVAGQEQETAHAKDS